MKTISQSATQLTQVILCLIFASTSYAAAPDCSQATAIPSVIWPANHKMIPIGIGGLEGTDISVQCVRQDEPLNSNGDGNTEFDAEGIGSDTAYVRAERSGGGSGRVYYIDFLAINADGQCRGSVEVGVPPSAKKAVTGDGPIYVSAADPTQCGSPPENRPPVIESLPVTGARVGESYHYTVVASDPDGDSVSFTLIEAPEGMTIDAGSGAIQWSPTLDDLGDHSVEIVVSDNRGASTVQSFILSVLEPLNYDPQIISVPPLQAPVAQVYTYNVVAEDPDQDALEFSLVTAPAGMVIDPAMGTIDWIPTAQQIGDHTVSLFVSDSHGGSATQTYTLTVPYLNADPVISSQPTPQAVLNQLYNYQILAADPDGDTLTYSLNQAPTGMSVDTLSGLVSWTPVAGQSGDHVVELLVSDSRGGMASQLYTLTVLIPNSNPVITSTPILTASTNEPYLYQVVASDSDGDPLTFSLGGTSPAGMVMDNATGAITWTPDSGQVGNHTVVVIVSDGRDGSASQTFTLEVIASNQAPVITSTPVTSVNERTLYSYDVEAQDPDSGDTISFQLAASPQAMTIDPTTGIIQWSTTSSDIGDHSVTVMATDNRGLSGAQTFTVTVVNTNDIPVAQDLSLVTQEDFPLSVTLQGSDIDGDVLTYAVTSPPDNGQLTGSAPDLLYTPAANFSGTDNFEYEVSDGPNTSAIATVTVTVSPVNDVPQWHYSPALTARENVGYSTTALATDADGDALAYSLITSPLGMTINSATGLITWVPDFDQAGAHTVSLTVNDSNGGSNSDSFTIVVSDTNRAPQFTSTPVASGEENIQYQYVVAAVDPDGDAVSYSLQQSPLSMTIDSVTGTINWTPVYGEAGDHTVTIDVTDGELSATQTFTLSITPGNRPPSITSTPVYTAIEAQLYQYRIVTSDPDNDPVTIVLLSAPTGMSVDNVTGSLVWIQPTIGSHTVTLEVSDSDGASVQQSYTLNVVPKTPPVTNQGTDFWVMFNRSFDTSNNEFKLFFVPETDTDITVEINGIGFNQVYPAVANQVLMVDLTTEWNNYKASSSTGKLFFELGVQPWAVHIHGAAPFNAFLLSNGNATADATLLYPIESLGTDYLVLADSNAEAAGNLGPLNEGNLLGVVATQDNTQVVISPVVDMYITKYSTPQGYDGTIVTAGATHTLVLNQGETFQAQGPRKLGNQGLDFDADLSGTSIQSNKPVAVFSGDECIAIGIFGACDHVIEQVPPTSSWGVQHFTLPFASRARGDRFKVYAAYDDTHVWINGSLVAQLDHGEYHTTVLDAVSVIKGSRPIAVAQFAHSNDYDDGWADRTLPSKLADPFMVLVPPAEQYLSRYVFTTPTDSIALNYINVIAPASEIAQIVLDGVPVAASAWVDLPGGAWKGAQLSITPGEHVISGGTGFGLYVYGFDFFKSYGYLGGLSFAEQIAATDLLLSATSLTPKLGDTVCIDAQLLDTQQPIAKVQVLIDRIVSGAVRRYARTTDVSGIASFCYTSEAPGAEQIDVTAQGITHSLTIDWQPGGSADLPPIFFTHPEMSALPGGDYSYRALARDPDQDALTYSLTVAPTGMTIDPVTGLIQWPVPGSFDRAPIVINVSDGTHNVSQSFELKYKLRSNRYPDFLSTPITSIASGAVFDYRVAVRDVDGTSMTDLTFAVEQGPPGMSFVNLNQLHWQTTDADVGDHPISISITDPSGDTTTQDFVLTVHQNTPPVFTTTPITNATVAHDYYSDFNVTDAEGGQLTYSLGAAPAGMIINSVSTYVRWTPATSQIGTHLVEIVVTDNAGASTVQSYTVTVIDNGVPQIDSLPPQVAYAGHPYSGPIVVSDPDGDRLTVTLDVAPAGMTKNITHVLRWTPTDSDVGVHPVTFTAADPYGASVTVTFDLQVFANNLPVFTSTPPTSWRANQMLRSPLSATDADGDSVVFRLQSGPSGMSISSNQIVWRPGNDQTGAHSIAVEADDRHGGITVQRFTLTVDPDQPPAFTTSPIKAARVGTQYTYDAGAVDPEGDTVTIVKESGPAALNWVWLYSPAGTGKSRIYWTPTAADEGRHSVVLKAHNATYGNPTYQRYTITVVGSTLKITGFPDVPVYIDHNQPWQTTIQALHPDGLPVTFSLGAGAPAGMQIDAQTGVISWTPTFAQIGTHTVTVIAGDGNGQQDSVTFAIFVQQGPDQPPTIDSSPIVTAYVDTPYSYAVQATDPEGQALTFELLSAPPAMTIDAATGTLNWTPGSADLGTHTVTLRVFDPQGLDAVQSFTLAVAEYPDLPVITSTPPNRVRIEDGLSYPLQVFDPEGDPLTYSVDTGPAGMTVDSNGLVTWSPQVSDIGLHTITLSVSDDQGHSTPQIFELRVTGPGPFNRRQCR